MPNMTEGGARGSGRTRRMVDSLPRDGSVIVVYNSATRDHIQGMTADFRSNLGAPQHHIVVLQDQPDLARLRGLSAPIFVDHSFWELAPYALARPVEDLIVEQRARAELARFAEGICTSTRPRWMEEPVFETRYQGHFAAGERPGAERTRRPVRAQTYDGPEAEDL